MPMPPKTIEPLTEAQRALAADEGHIALARRIAARFAAKCPRNADDIERAALYGLVLAAQAFDPARSNSFTKYAEHRICGEIVDSYRMSRPVGVRRSKGPATHSLDAPLNFSRKRLLSSTDGGIGLYYRDLVPGEDGPVGAELEFIDTVTVLACRLPPKFATAFLSYFTRAEIGTSSVAVARDMGLSESRVSQMFKETFALLREDATLAPVLQGGV